MPAEWRFSIWVACLLSLTLVGMAHAQNPNSSGMPLGHVEEKAKKAKKGDKASVREFVDEMLDRSLLKGAPSSVRDRITAAEDAYRRRHHPPIREDEFSNAINKLVDDFKAAPHMKTNKAQVRRFRKLMTHMVPNAISSTGNDEMSPAEAVLIGLHLGAQKWQNADYAVSPDEWVRSVDQLVDKNGYRGWKGQARSQTDQPRLINFVVSGDTAVI